MPAKDANYTQQAVKIQYNLLENIHRIKLSRSSGCGVTTPTLAPSLPCASRPCTRASAWICPAARSFFTSPSALCITGPAASTTSRTPRTGCCGCSTAWNCLARPGKAGASMATSWSRLRDTFCGHRQRLVGIARASSRHVRQTTSGRRCCAPAHPGTAQGHQGWQACDRAQGHYRGPVRLQKKTPASATNTPGAMTNLGKDKIDGTDCRS